MKKLKLSVLVTLLAIGSSYTLTAQTADEIIKKHVDAVGGWDNWKNIVSLKETGVINFGGTEMPVVITIINGKGNRMDMTILGKANYMIITPEKGWMYFPAQGQTKAEAIPDEQVKEQQDQLDVTQDPLIDYKAKGNKVVALGKDDVEGTDCFKLKVTDKSGKETTVFLDATTYNIIRTKEKAKANGKEVESTTNYTNYQKQPEGIIIPMSIESEDGPVTIKSVEVNKSLDVSIFKPAEEKK